MRLISLLVALTLVWVQFAGCAGPHRRPAGPPVELLQTDVQRHIVAVLHDGSRVEGYLVRWDERTIVLQEGQSNRIVHVAELKELVVEEPPGTSRMVFTVVFYVALGAGVAIALLLSMIHRTFDSSS